MQEFKISCVYLFKSKRMGEVSVSDSITGLDSDTAYHCRIVATKGSPESTSLIARTYGLYRGELCFLNSCLALTLKKGGHRACTFQKNLHLSGLIGACDLNGHSRFGKRPVTNNQHKFTFQQSIKPG